MGAHRMSQNVVSKADQLHEEISDKLGELVCIGYEDDSSTECEKETMELVRGFAYELVKEVIESIPKYKVGMSNSEWGGPAVPALYVHTEGGIVYQNQVLTKLEERLKSLAPPAPIKEISSDELRAALIKEFGLERAEKFIKENMQ